MKTILHQKYDCVTSLNNIKIEIFTFYLQVRAGGRDAATAEETPPSMQEMCSGDGWSEMTGNRIEINPT